MEKEKFITIEKEIKDVDEKKGIVTMYVNAYDNEDSDGDISVKGSFKKTIKENFDRIKHLLNHNTQQLLGLPLEMLEDDFGLLVTSQMNLKKQLVKDVFEDYRLFAEHNRTLEHSIRVQAVKRDSTDEKKVLEWKMWEYSTLYGWGANPETPLVNIKDLSDLELMINEGNYSEERGRQIENLYNKLKALMKPENTLYEPPSTSGKSLLEIFSNNLNI